MRHIITYNIRLMPMPNSQIQLIIIRWGICRIPNDERTPYEYSLKSLDNQSIIECAVFIKLWCRVVFQPEKIILFVFQTETNQKWSSRKCAMLSNRLKFNDCIQINDAKQFWILLKHIDWSGFLIGEFALFSQLKWFDFCTELSNFDEIH